MPGTYTTVIESGNYSSGFTPVSGNWLADQYTQGTPTPAPTATATASSGPTSTPGPTPTPATYYIWSGTYSVAAFNITSPAAAVNATSGCLTVVATAGGSSPNAAAFGAPTFAGNTNVTAVGAGQISSFSIPNLALNNGPFSGTFTLDSGANGTLTVNSFQSITIQSFDRRLFEQAIRNRGRF